MTKFAPLALVAGLAVSLGACATTGTEDSSAASSNKDWAAPLGADDRVPVASTYERYPGRPTALVGAMVYDGKGGRIDNGTVLLRDGEVVAVGLREKLPPLLVGRSMFRSLSWLDNGIG